MKNKRNPSITIELPLELRADFMSFAKTNDQHGSQIIRNFIKEYVDRERNKAREKQAA